MNLLNKKSATSLKKESESILSVFTKTKDKLAELVVKQEQYSKELSDQMLALKAEQDLVNADIADNNSVINKIKNILS